MALGVIHASRVGLGRLAAYADAQAMQKTMHSVF